MNDEQTEVGEKLLENGNKTIYIVKQDVKTKPVLSVVDILLSVFIVTPLVVFTWRGLWNLLDLHAEYFPALPTFFIGIMIHILLALCQDSLHEAIIESEKHWSLKIVSHFLRRFYTYIFLVITIFHWRGGWLLIDKYTGVQYTNEGVVKAENSLWVLLVWSISFLTLLSIRSLRNATAPPYSICLDKGCYVFKFPTRFRKKVKDRVYLQILDCTFSVAVIGNLVVYFWRGMWIITDILLILNDFLWSSWASMIIGILLVALVFRLQDLMKRLCADRKGLIRIVFADFYIILSIISTIFYWRGAWNLVVIYFLPSNPELSCILSHLIGFMFLLVLGCSNSLLVRGVYKDGKESNGECVVFPCLYLQLILEQENFSGSEISEDISSATKTMTDLNGHIKV